MPMFLSRLGARRPVGLRLRTEAAARLFETLFGKRGVPHGDTRDDLYARLSVEAVQEKLTRFTEIIEAVPPIRITPGHYATIIAKRVQVRFQHRPPLTTLAGQIYVPGPDTS
jgi:hypothetical protein